jgi:hypothetical protein
MFSSPKRTFTEMSTNLSEESPSKQQRVYGRKFIYCCGKQSPACLDYLKELKGFDGIGFSNPRYNQYEDTRKVFANEFFADVPYYTFEHASMVEKLMTNEMLVEAIRKLGFAVPKVKLDAMVIRKLLDKSPTGDIELLLATLTLMGHVTHVANIRKFQECMSNIPSTIGCRDEMIAWQTSLDCILKKDFGKYLHYDQVFQCFGEEAVTPKQIQEFMAAAFDPNSAEPELKTLDQVCGMVSWLGKALNVFKLDGSSADFMNLIEYLFSKTDMKGIPIEEKIRYVLDRDFKLPKELPWLIPSLLLIDGEWDDDWTAALVWLLCHVNGYPQPRLVLQRPGGNMSSKWEKFKMTKEEFTMKLQLRFREYERLALFFESVEHFDDESSANGDKMLR